VIVFVPGGREARPYKGGFVDQGNGKGADRRLHGICWGIAFWRVVTFGWIFVGWVGRSFRMGCAELPISRCACCVVRLWRCVGDHELAG
jgi:hypothetical protein